MIQFCECFIYVYGLDVGGWGVYGEYSTHGCALYVDFFGFYRGC
ncbi:UNVERIFIED_ORG: hypothetical protein J2Y77_001129 [Pseudomonas lini]